MKITNEMIELLEGKLSEHNRYTFLIADRGFNSIWREYIDKYDNDIVTIFEVLTAIGFHVDDCIEYYKMYPYYKNVTINGECIFKEGK